MVEGTGTVSDKDESASSDDDIQIRDKATTGLPVRIRNMKTTASAGTGGVKVKAWTDSEVHKFVSTLRINVDTQFMSSHKKQSLNGVSSADLAYSLMRTNEDLSKDVIKRAHVIVSSTFGLKLKNSTRCSSCGHTASSSTNEN
jgi:hypothetical protein